MMFPPFLNPLFSQSSHRIGTNGQHIIARVALIFVFFIIEQLRTFFVKLNKTMCRIKACFVLKVKAINVTTCIDIFKKLFKNCLNVIIEKKAQ